MTPELIIVLLIINEVVRAYIRSSLFSASSTSFAAIHALKMKCEAFVFFVIPLLTKAFHAWLQDDPYRVENGFITYGGFHPSFYHSLTATQIAITLSEDILDCGFACMAKPKCASFNVAAKPDSSGSFLCELLETGMYYDSGKLQGNASFHHYSPVSLIYSVIF